MKIQKSAEDYLEMILRLSEGKGYARSTDIAAALSVSRPSVSVAMKNLRLNGYIDMDADSHITLTPQGMAIARRVYDRHRMLKKALLHIGVSEETAEADACLMEHVISDETEGRLRRALDNCGRVTP